MATINVQNQAEFDSLIGRLDRILSEFLVAAGEKKYLDRANVQTMKHHADDLIGVGNKALELLKVRQCICAPGGTAHDMMPDCPVHGA